MQTWPVRFIVGLGSPGTTSAYILGNTDNSTPAASTTTAPINVVGLGSPGTTSAYILGSSEGSTPAAATTTVVRGVAAATTAAATIYVTVPVMMNGLVSDYDSQSVNAIKSDIAQQTGCDASLISITISAGSVVASVTLPSASGTLLTQKILNGSIATLGGFALVRTDSQASPAPDSGANDLAMSPSRTPVAQPNASMAGTAAGDSDGDMRVVPGSPSAPVVSAVTNLFSPGSLAPTVGVSPTSSTPTTGEVRASSPSAATFRAPVASTGGTPAVISAAEANIPAVVSAVNSSPKVKASQSDHDMSSLLQPGDKVVKVVMNGETFRLIRRADGHVKGVLGERASESLLDGP